MPPWDEFLENLLDRLKHEPRIDLKPEILRTEMNNWSKDDRKSFWNKLIEIPSDKNDFNGREILRLKAFAALILWDWHSDRPDSCDLLYPIVAWWKIVREGRGDSIYMNRYRAADDKSHPKDDKKIHSQTVAEREMEFLLYDERGDLRKFFCDNTTLTKMTHTWFLQGYDFSGEEKLYKAYRKTPDSKYPWWRFYTILPRLFAAILIGYIPFYTSFDAWQFLQPIARVYPEVCIGGSIFFFLFFWVMVYLEVIKQSPVTIGELSTQTIGKTKESLWKGVRYRFRRMRRIIELALLYSLFMAFAGLYVFCWVAPNYGELIILYKSDIWIFVIFVTGAQLIGYVLSLIFDDKTLADPF